MTDKVFIKGQRVKITNPQTGIVTSGTATGNQAKNGLWEIHSHKLGFVLWFPGDELKPDEPEPTEPAPAPARPDITTEYTGKDITIASTAQGVVLAVDFGELDKLVKDLIDIQDFLKMGTITRVERKKILDDYCALHD